MQPLLQDVRAAHGAGQWLASTDANDPRAPIFDPQPERPVGKSPFSRRVLVVEDHLETAHSLVRLLREMGHEAEYAINGYDALRLAQHMRPEFVFLDLDLPGMNGFEVCSRIKGDPVLRDARVIAITGYSQDMDRARSRAVGCELHLSKPVNPALLARVLAAGPQGSSVQFVVRQVDDYIRGDLYNRQTAAETRQFLQAVAEEASTKGCDRVLLAAHASRAIFKVEDFGLSEFFDIVASRPGHRVALTADNFEGRAAQKYMEVLATIRKLNVRAFRSETDAVKWLQAGSDAPAGKKPH